MSKQHTETVQSIMREFIDTFDEYVICMYFATSGIRDYGEKLALGSFSDDHQTWIGSKLDSNPDMHAKKKQWSALRSAKRAAVFLMKSGSLYYAQCIHFGMSYTVTVWLQLLILKRNILFAL